jgi:nitrogen-specific signal transduction histidine kinase
MKNRGFNPFRRRVGQDVRAWPMVALLVIVVLVAVGCVLWFMREAIRNEGLAVRDQLDEAYRANLGLVQARVLERWNRGLIQLDGPEPGSALFARCVRNGLADSVISLDVQGRIAYPCLSEGRSATANAELFALESLPDRTNQQFTIAVVQLRDQVNDYGTNTLPSAQRRFIMHELRRVDPSVQLPTLMAEELAGRYLDANPSFPTDAIPQATELHDVWAVASPGRRVVALFTTDGLKAKLQVLVNDISLPKGENVAVMAPGEYKNTQRLPLVFMNVFGGDVRGWSLMLSVDSMARYNTAVRERVVPYVAVGCVLIFAMLVSAVLLARGLGQQVRLARLKNDLVANVSHELKTPLTAMRALVDTLLDTERFDEKTTREYLKLLATENARLSRLIDNFLTFSRLERNKFNFVFARVRPQQIVEDAVTAMGERAHAPGCTVESHVAAGVPEINGDADALTTALLNLLDNAWKYSGDHKHIVVRAEARDGHVDFAVEDNGIGLSPHEQRRVFRRFYQSDQRLARTAGGCGLGLSIVQSIVEAHHGSVRVESEPGRGSTFIIEIPAVGGSAS